MRHRMGVGVWALGLLNEDLDYACPLVHQKETIGVALANCIYAWTT